MAARECGGSDAVSAAAAGAAVMASPAAKLHAATADLRPALLYTPQGAENRIPLPAHCPDAPRKAVRLFEAARSDVVITSRNSGRGCGCESSSPMRAGQAGRQQQLRHGDGERVEQQQRARTLPSRNLRRLFQPLNFGSPSRDGTCCK
eukprot:TRINITY_DN70527_c0_g1_i1.p1 TRINITY_DN70527_c0_g1~~TRINITY_DN70527_c0_g1_i1.p1  ORF type:complete len:172 (-),score=2.44 TRINITY_DN70527_c0_g1_i1:94-537(-)